MSIKAKFLQSSGWVLLGTGADNLIQFVIFAMLARLLSLETMGIVAFVIVLIDIGRIFVNGGLPDAIIQRKHWDAHFGSVCFTFNMIMALVFAILVTAVGGPLMETYYGAGSGIVLTALSLLFVLEALRAVHAAKLRREFRYRSLAIRGTIAGIIGGGGAIWLAYLGFGVWALVFQRLMVASVVTVATWYAAGWMPKPALSRSVMREVFPFSARVTTSKAIEILSQRIPDILIGVLLGPAALAIYRVGARAIDAVTKLAIQPFQDAAFAAFSRVGSPAGIGDAYRRVTQAASLFTFPVFIGTALIAPELVVLLFGTKYIDSGPVLVALALGSVPATITYFSSAAYVAAAETRAAVRANSVSAIFSLLFSGLFVFLLGTLGAGVAYAVTRCVVVPYNLLMLRRYLQMPAHRVLNAVLTPFLAASGMGLLLLALKYYVLVGMNPVAVIASSVAFGAVVYPMLLAIGGRPYLRSLNAELSPVMPRILRKWFSR